MTTEIEKTFFDTFGIEQKYEDGTCDMDDKCRYTDCNTCQRINKFNYPQITDSILLQLICIANSQNIGFEGDNIEDIKKDLLDNFIFFKRDVYDQIHNLFKEVE